MEFQEVFDELDGFVKYLAGTRQRPDDVLMSADELMSELYEEMVKGFQTYGHLPQGELIAVLKRMMDNRVAELVYRYFVTHRGEGVNARSLSTQYDSDTEEDAATVRMHEQQAFSIEAEISVVIGTRISIDPSVIYESRDRVLRTRECLSRDAKKVFDVIMESHPLLEQHIKLAGMRASFVYKGAGTVKVQDWQVADVLQLDVKKVRRLFTEIKETYEDICNE